MHTIRHETTIQAHSDIVYRAITEQKGLRSWWTSDSTAEPIEGSTAVFGFNNRQTVFEMHIDKLDKPNMVEWTCTGGPDEWKGTRVCFFLEEIDNGYTLLQFVHADWQSVKGIYSLCDRTWAELMGRLKGYAEGKAPGPLFRS